MMARVNEFGETLSREELIEWTERIRRLPDELVDELWYLCGYIVDEEKDAGFKALPRRFIERIRESFTSALDVVESLWLETPTEEIRKNLAIVEKQLQEEKNKTPHY